MPPLRLLLLGAMMIALTACASNKAQEQAALTLPADNLAQRQMQSRRFDTTDEAKILTASAAVLQDLGFNIEETSVPSGLVVASKDRGAIEAQQVAGRIILAALVQALTHVQQEAIYDTTQKIRISVVTRLSADHQAVVTRAIFQRVVYNNKGQVAHMDAIDASTIYLQFFEKLSESVFLEAHQI